MVPVYIDEISYQMLDARAGYDGFVCGGLFPMCKSGSLLSVPFFWRPAKLAYWAVYNPVVSLQTFRYMGIAVALISVLALTALAAVALAARGFKKWLSFGFVMAACSFGVLPFLLTLNRPEAPLAACIGWFAFAPFILSRLSRKMQLSGLVFSFAVLSFGLGLHPKMMLFAPLALVVFGIQSVKLWGRYAAIAVCGLAVLFFAQSFLVYAKSSRCPESPQVAAFVSDQYYMPGAADFARPGMMLKKLVWNVFSFRAYIARNGFNAAYMMDWLPPVSRDSSTHFFNVVIRRWFEVLFFAAFVLSGVCCREWRSDKLVLVPLSLAVSLAGLMSIQTAKNFYEGAFIIPLCAVLLCTALAALPYEKMRSYLKLFFGATIIISGASLVFALDCFKEPLREQYVSYSANLESTGADMAALRAEYGAELKLPHIATDDVGYMYLKHSALPYNLGHLIPGLNLELGPKALSDKKTLFGEFEKYGVSGIVARCSYIAPIVPLASTAVRIGDTCYIGPAALSSY